MNFSELCGRLCSALEHRVVVQHVSVARHSNQSEHWNSQDKNHERLAGAVLQGANGLRIEALISIRPIQRCIDGKPDCGPLRLQYAFEPRASRGASDVRRFLS